MKRKALLLLTTMVFALVMASGVALATISIQCYVYISPCEGTEGPDHIRGDWGGTGDYDETIYAYGGDDDVYPEPGDDTVYAGEGSDYVFGFLGNDTIYGGPGGDKNLEGAEDSDTIYGEGGSDFIDIAQVYLEGEDYASGGPGNDTIHAFDGKKDTINCGRGTKDHVYYDKGIDTVSRNCEKKHPNVAPF